MTWPSTAEIALEVDRLVIGVHRAVISRHRSRFRDLVGTIGLESPGHLYDLAEFLADGKCRVEIARRRYRYEPDDAVGVMVNRLHERQLVDDQLRPCGTLVDVLDTMLEARAEAAANLWGGELAAATRGATEALSSASGTMVNAFRSLPEPTPPAHRLHHLLAGVRYARLDTHIDAWEEAGLTATEIVALSSAVTSEPVSPAPQGLIARGWMTVQGTATAEGHAGRSTIEAGTNERCDAMFGAVTDLPGWFAAIRSLATPG